MENDDIGDVAAKALADNPRLRTLSLTGTKLTDDGLGALAKAKGLTLLQAAGTKVTKRGVEAYLKARGGKIDHDAKE